MEVITEIPNAEYHLNSLTNIRNSKTIAERTNPAYEIITINTTIENSIVRILPNALPFGKIFAILITSFLIDSQI